jgi:hypothetical protein
LFVHIGGPSSNQATTLESQMIHMVQELFGQTLKSDPSAMCKSATRLKRLQIYGQQEIAP